MSTTSLERPPGSVPQGFSVEFRNVSKVYATPRGSLQALRDVDLGIRRGEIFGFIGRSGAGKSTLIRLINRLETVTTGQVLVNGAPNGELGTRALETLRRSIGMIFQHFNLMSAKTVEQNIGLPLMMAGKPRDVIAAKVSELLDLVGLTDRRHAYPAQLSGGQKQRVGIARSLVHSPDILLCDEATSALDPETTKSILSLIKDVNRRLGLTVILITHEMEVIREICDRVAVLQGGAIVEHGEVWSVFGDPQHPASRLILGHADQKLPDDLAERLRPTRRCGSDAALVQISFSAGEGTPDLRLLSNLAGGWVKVLSSSIERIQGHSFGSMILAVEAAEGNDLGSRLQDGLRGADCGLTIGILGYVSGPV